MSWRDSSIDWAQIPHTTQFYTRMVNVCRQCVGMKSGEIVCGEKTQLRLKLWIPTTVVCQSNKMPVEPKQTVERLSKWENLLFCSQHYFKIEHFPLHMLATTLGLNVDNANCMLTSTLWVMHFHSETPKLERILLLILLKCYSTMRKESEYVAFFLLMTYITWQGNYICKYFCIIACMTFMPPVVQFTIL